MPERASFLTDFGEHRDNSRNSQSVFLTVGIRYNRLCPEGNPFRRNPFFLKPSNMDELEEAISAMCENLKKKSITGEESAATGEAAEKAEAKEEDGTSEVTAGDGTGAQENAAAQPHESASSSFIVKNALKYIEANYNQKLTLCEVAEKTYVSQWHLSKLLNRHTGQSFSDILNHCRIEHAKKLLEDPSLRIGDISDAVGFLNLAHFSRVFKKQEGMSANEWRNQKLGS